MNAEQALLILGRAQSIIESIEYNADAEDIEKARAYFAELIAERDDLKRRLTSIADHCRDVYAVVPCLPIEESTMDAATDALVAFCNMLGIEGIDIRPTYVKQGPQA